MQETNQKAEGEISQEIETDISAVQATEAAGAVATMTEEAPLPEKKKTKKKVSGKKKIGRVILLVVALAIAFGMYKLLAPKKDTALAVTNPVVYGSITSMVQGNGTTRAKESATITITTAGKVGDVFVKEGDHVEIGTPLYTIDSETASTAVEKARKDLDGYQKQFKALNDDIAGLNLSVPFAGKLLETEPLKTGDAITKGKKVAKLVDDSRMRLTQYYSYAYKDLIKVGQTATISIPAQMSQVTGTVEKVHMVNRISAEGSKLFEVVFVMKNPGTLAADASASAVVNSGKEMIYPYESAKLEYYQSVDVLSKVDGTVNSNSMINYMNVGAGQVILRIDGADSENALFTLEQSLKTAQTAYDTAKKNLDNMNALSPIAGTVLALGITPGAEVAAGTTTINIANTTVMLVEANVDERNISFVKAGMSVDLDQWGTMYTGVVQSVSLAGKATNGVTTFPAVISVENPEGTMMAGSSITYKLLASQSDNCLTLPIQCIKYVQMEDGTTGTVVFVESKKRPENAIDLPTPPEGVPEGYFAIPVTIGISDNYNVEILSGVEENTVVFTQMQVENSWN